MSLDNVRQIPLDQLRISEYQARTRNIEDGLEDLIANIRVHGQLEPIVVVSTNGDGPPYSIIVGQRRFLAHQRLGKSSILSIVRTDAPDRHLVNAISVSENLIRKDLTDRDLIDACTSLYQRYGSVKDVAQELGLPYPRVRSCIKYERLQPELKEVVQQDKLNVQAALRLQDHLDDCPEDDHPDVGELINIFAPMTRAQQDHYLKARALGDNRADPDGRTENLPVQHQAIIQVLVTLSREDHYRLRAWAKEQRLTQDKAGAQIISSFLSSK